MKRMRVILKIAKLMKKAKAQLKRTTKLRKRKESTLRKVTDH